MYSESGLIYIHFAIWGTLGHIGNIEHDYIVFSMIN